MEILPTNAETKTEAQMSDVALAHNLIKEIAGHCWRGKGDMIDRVHNAIIKRYPNWTRRRVRGFYHKESAIVKYHEMMQLADVSELERQNRENLEEARRSHAEYIRQNSILAARLETQDEAFHGPQIEAMGSEFGRVDRPGVAR